MSEEGRTDLLEQHSLTIFKNADTFGLINQEKADSFVSGRVYELLELTGGEIEIQSVTASSRSGQIEASVTLSDGRSEAFQLRDEKSADTSPLFKAMNRLAKSTGKGSFVGVYNGSDDGEIFIYLRPAELKAFHAWAERQNSEGDPGLIDWLD